MNRNGFFQDGPRLGNQFREDRVLQSTLRNMLYPEVFGEIEAHLDHLGALAAGEIFRLGIEAEANPPRHVPFDAWGRRVDRIVTSPAWSELKAIAAREGLVATAYERRFGAQSRLYQAALLYLFHPSSAIYTCPLAMTDGAARTLELFGGDGLKQGPLQRLTSRDPMRFWTSGQWMTERAGGSDVGGSETRARAEGDGYRLYGTKWFTSATTSEMALTLARPEGAVAGSRGLSLFYVERHGPDGELNHIRVHRLKDKLGTRALPTAELSLEGSRALMIGEPGRGVPTIATLFNITRIYNALSAVGYMRRGLALAKDYAGRRQAFGKPLNRHPLHLQTLADLEIRFRACFLLVFHTAALLGREENGEATAAESAVLRLLTPIVKLFTAKQAVSLCSEVLECFGGAGYVEDTHLPVLLRNAQVLPIWEGTTNILSLDCWRALARERAFEPFREMVVQRLERLTPAFARPGRDRLISALDRLAVYIRQAENSDREHLELGARALALNLAWLYSGSLLLEQAVLEQGPEALSTRAAASAWCGQNPPPLIEANTFNLEQARLLGS